MRQLKTKLQPSGKVHVGNRREMIGNQVELCKKCEYSLTEVRPMTEMEISASLFAQTDLELIKAVKSMEQGKGFFTTIDFDVHNLFDYMKKTHLLEPMIFSATANSK